MSFANWSCNCSHWRGDRSAVISLTPIDRMTTSYRSTGLSESKVINPGESRPVAAIRHQSTRPCWLIFSPIGRKVLRPAMRHPRQQRLSLRQPVCESMVPGRQSPPAVRAAQANGVSHGERAVLATRGSARETSAIDKVSTRPFRIPLGACKCQDVPDLVLPVQQMTAYSRAQCPPSRHLLLRTFADDYGPTAEWLAGSASLCAPAHRICGLASLGFNRVGQY
jgi:hypothetical protein